MIDDRPSLVMNVSTIDAEHMHFENFIKLMKVADEEKCHKLLNLKFLNNMLALVKKHIEHEEELMFVINYPHINEQILSHSTIITKLLDVIDGYNGLKNAQSVLIEIAIMIDEHHMESDQKLAKFVRARKAPRGQQERAFASK